MAVNYQRNSPLDAGRLKQTYLGGMWHAATGATDWPIINPATEETLGIARSAGIDQIAAAAKAAQAALPAWASTTAAERADLLRAIADRIDAAAELLAALVTSEVGTPVAVCAAQQVRTAARIFQRTADIACEIAFTAPLGHSEIRRVPVGVVACITPWNYPLYLAACKLAPALAAGCTVILKPSEQAPLAVHALAQTIDAVGLPRGVFNLVGGPGVQVGAQLVEAAGVDFVSFTGSAASGASIAAQAGRMIRRVSLELGGKSAVVVLEDGDLHAAVGAGAAKCFQNAGQTCAAFSRLIVPASRLKEAEAMAESLVAEYRLGDPTDVRTTMGPLVSGAQRTRVREIIDAATRQGARLVCGGSEPPPQLPRGFYVRPTLLSGVEPSMRVAKDEVFGPVLCILSYRNEHEAYAISEATDFGLSGAVWAADAGRATEFARRLRVGSISINGAAVNPDAPFGGFHRSGFGRERGRAGIEEFLTTQALHLPEATRPPGPWKP